MEKTHNFDHEAWRNKAMAFVVRSHRHLWGKNNEDPLAFLFNRGLKNDFARKLYLGWNKFSQKRPMENWGFSNIDSRQKTFLLPAGIVVPYIIEKELISVFIYRDESAGSAFFLPGSLEASMVLGCGTDHVVFMQDVMDGLLTFQQSDPGTSIIIHPDPEQPVSTRAKNILNSAKDIQQKQ